VAHISAKAANKLNLLIIIVLLLKFRKFILKKTKENQENPFLLFMSFTHSFSISLSEIPSKLALSISHIENNLRFKQQKRKTEKTYDGTRDYRQETIDTFAFHN
jgi:hypothetical protein